MACEGLGRGVPRQGGAAAVAFAARTASHLRRAPHVLSAWASQKTALQGPSLAATGCCACPACLAVHPACAHAGDHRSVATLFSLFEGAAQRQSQHEMQM